MGKDLPNLLPVKEHFAPISHTYREVMRSLVDCRRFICFFALPQGQSVITPNIIYAGLSFIFHSFSVP